jgi:hypothetical protein
VKVVVVGGYGVFGSRLAELLLRDGHVVWVAGRDLAKARELTNVIGGHPMGFDVHATPEKILDPGPDIVIDATGPFQANQEYSYRIPRLCLDSGVDYLDLSDDAQFTAGISTLDEAARKQDLRLLSGASSVPGLSSSVAAEFCRSFDEILLIDSVILPGNRAPRGASVIASIVSQLGKSSPVWRGGVWRDQSCWSARKRVRLAPDLSRTGYFIEVPDILLFPDFFRARSVMFRAGMELGLLNIALRVLGVLRRVWPFEVSPGRVRFMQWCANCLLPFGTDRGGMSVTVVGRTGAGFKQREWRMIAAAGDGPYIPCITARALLRRWEQVAPGARPCLAELTLAEIEAAMSDLSVTTAVEETAPATLFQSSLGDRWGELPTAVRDLHSVHDMESFSGTAHVDRGKSLFARFLAWVFRFPPAGNDVPITVTMTRTECGETWERSFDGHILKSYCTPAQAPYCYRERFWLINFELDLRVEDGYLHLPVRRGWFAGLPLPRFLLPRSDSREYVQGGEFRFDITLSAPLGVGLLARYCGYLRPDRREPLPAEE